MITLFYTSITCLPSCKLLPSLRLLGLESKWSGEYSGHVTINFHENHPGIKRKYIYILKENIDERRVVQAM